VKPGILMGTVQQRQAVPVVRRSAPANTSVPAFIPPAPTVEIIRGDKRQNVTVG